MNTIVLLVVVAPLKLIGPMPPIDVMAIAEFDQNELVILEAGVGAMNCYALIFGSLTDHDMTNAATRCWRILGLSEEARQHVLGEEAVKNYKVVRGERHKMSEEGL